MTDTQPLNPEPEENPEPSSTGEPPTEPPTSTGKKRSKWITIYRLLLIGIAIVVAIILFIFNAEKPKVESAIDASMTAMKDGDVDKAYALMSNRTKTYYVSLADLERMQQQNSLEFSNYQGVAITYLKVQKAVANDPSLPQGTVATVEGELYFADDIVEPFTAVLEKEEGEWRLFTINIGEAGDPAGP